MPTLAATAHPSTALANDLATDLAERWLRRAANWLLQVAEARRDWRQRRDEARLTALAEGLSEALLHDIGAPDWLHDVAAARREADRQRAAALRATSVGALFG